VKRIKLDRKHGDTERRILIGMVTNKEFLRDIQLIYKRKYMASSYSVLIAKWCIDFYKEFKKAPGVHIQDIFNDAIENKTLNEEPKIKSIERFLSKLSKEYERSTKFNAEFMLKRAKIYFNSRAFEILSQEVEDLKNKGKEEEAAELLDSFRKIEIPTDDVIDLRNVRQILEVFDREDSNPLFRVHGGLGEMINDEFKRQCFVGFLGPEKIGKTWLLLELAMKAVKDKCNVAFIQAGDMSRDQQLRRFATYITNKTANPKYVGTSFVPVADCSHNQTGRCEHPFRIKNNTPLFDDNGEFKNRLKLFSNRKNFSEFFEFNEDHIPCTECKNKARYKKFFEGTVWYKKQEIEIIRKRHIVAAHEKFLRKMAGDRFRMATFPNSTLTSDMIYAKLDSFREKEDFIVDVVIIDYPDIMAEEGAEFRHSENRRWKKLRALAQIFNCLVIVVTQADAKSYDQRSLNRSNFSEDKRKFSHTTAFFTLNQTSEEKAAGILRIGDLMKRDNEQIMEEVTVLQHLASGRPHITSFL
jgi:hypothetical protein